MINAINENFVMHRRLMLTIVMKIDDRKKDENFIVASEANETNETNEKKINETTTIDEATEEKKSNNELKLIFDENLFNNFNDHNF